jgi:hypothetical protein
MKPLTDTLVDTNRITLFASWVTEAYTIPLCLARQNGEVFLTWFGGTVGFGARIGIGSSAADSPLALTLLEELVEAGYRNVSYVGRYHRRGKKMYLIDFNALRRKVNIIDVFCICGFKLLRQKGDQYRGPCVLHGSGSDSTSFSMNAKTGAWQCFKCKEHGGWLDFYMKAQSLTSPFAAAKRLANDLKIDLPWREKT